MVLRSERSFFSGLRITISSYLYIFVDAQQIIYNSYLRSGL